MKYIGKKHKMTKLWLIESNNSQFTGFYNFINDEHYAN